MKALMPAASIGNAKVIDKLLHAPAASLSRQLRQTSISSVFHQDAQHFR